MAGSPPCFAGQSVTSGIFTRRGQTKERYKRESVISGERFIREKKTYIALMGFA